MPRRVRPGVVARDLAPAGTPSSRSFPRVRARPRAAGDGMFLGGGQDLLDRVRGVARVQPATGEGLPLVRGEVRCPSMSSSAVSPASSGTGNTSARRLAAHSPSGVTAGAFDAAGLALAIMPKSASSAVSPSILGIRCEESPDSTPYTSTSRSRESQISSAASRTYRSRPRPAGAPSSCSTFSDARTRTRKPCLDPGQGRPEQPKPRRSLQPLLPAAPRVVRRPVLELRPAGCLTALHGEQAHADRGAPRRRGVPAGRPRPGPPAEPDPDDRGRGPARPACATPLWRSGSSSLPRPSQPMSPPAGAQRNSRPARRGREHRTMAGLPEDSRTHATRTPGGPARGNARRIRFSLMPE